MSQVYETREMYLKLKMKFVYYYINNEFQIIRPHMSTPKFLKHTL